MGWHMMRIQKAKYQNISPEERCHLPILPQSGARTAAKNHAMFDGSRILRDAERAIHERRAGNSGMDDMRTS